jgi:trehalose-6-phosphate synthase
MARLIVVSNRVALPDQKAPTGGLAVGVLAALKGAEGGIWFGWSGKTQETPALEPVVVEHERIQFMTVDLPAATFNAINSPAGPLDRCVGAQREMVAARQILPTRDAA